MMGWACHPWYLKVRVHSWKSCMDRLRWRYWGALLVDSGYP